MNEKTDVVSDETQLEFAAHQRNTKHSGDDSSGELVTVEKGYTDVLVELPKEEERRILRKVDYRLVPLLALLYLVAFVDRSNIGNAKIAGLSKDLKLEGMMYNTAVTMFFISYGLFEVPSNIVLKLIRPSIWLSILMFSWGVVMTLMGIVKSYHGLLVARFFLGVAEVCIGIDLSDAVEC